MNSVAEIHSAAGSMAGYIFQLDIALIWLAKSQIGASVGIETLDDVAVKSGDGSLHLGQSKLSYTRNLYATGNPNFWKTFDIWIQLIADDTVDFARTEFHLISNFPIRTGFVSKLKKARGSDDFSQLAKELKVLGSETNAECQKFAESIIQATDDVITQLLSQIRVCDSFPSHPEKQIAEFASVMNLTADIAPDVIRGMRGWMLEKAEIAFAERRPAWIQKEEFSAELMRLISLHYDNRIVLRAASEIVVKAEDRATAREAIFVEQMRWVDAQNDEMLDAIDDYFRSIDERTRLADDNNISRFEFDAFEGRLIERWKGIHRISSDTEHDSKRAGRIALRTSLEHREDLAGQSTSEYYLTRGTYHQLTNSKKASVGWHPEFKTLLMGLESKANEAHT